MRTISSIVLIIDTPSIVVVLDGAYLVVQDRKLIVILPLVVDLIALPLNSFLHEIEFESNSKKRALIDTSLHNSRVERRQAKDKAKALKPIKDFIGDASNRGFIKRLKRLQSDLQAEEDFLSSERVYKPRAKEETADGNNN